MSSTTSESQRADLPEVDMAATPLRAVRISDSIWLAAQRTASSNNETLTDVIRDALIHYASRDESHRVSGNGPVERLDHLERSKHDQW